MIFAMKRLRWNAAKNERLKEARGISFEEVVLAVAEGGLLDVLEHPNKRKYRNQKMFVVQCADYVYLIPFVETEEEIFLKTIIPSHKFAKKYRRSYEK